MQKLIQCLQLAHVPPVQISHTLNTNDKSYSGETTHLKQRVQKRQVFLQPLLQ